MKTLRISKILHFLPKVKVERATQKEKTIRVTIGGSRPTLHGILIGANGANHVPAEHSGPPPLKARVEERRKVNWTQALYGATFTKNLVTRPIGASIILFVQVVQLPIQTDYGARLVIAQAIPPLRVLPQPSAFLPREKEKDRTARAITVIGRGRAKTFPQITTLTKLLQLCMTNPLLLPPKTGGTITN
jgi:hypothetical protein